MSRLLFNPVNQGNWFTLNKELQCVTSNNDMGYLVKLLPVFVLVAFFHFFL